jgi:hypothetical protein
MDCSYVDQADPRHLEFDYLRWIRVVLEVARARRVLHIGGGACALARALAAADPEGRQEVCEVDADVLALARSHLGLRRVPGLHVRRAEGRAFVATQADGAWDAVVIDAFVGATVPARLVTLEALADIARIAPLVLVNLVDDRSARGVLSLAATLAALHPHVWTLGGRVGNTVVVASARRLDLRRVATRVAADPSPARLDGADSIQPRIAGTLPWRDADLTAAESAAGRRPLTRPFT